MIGSHKMKLIEKLKDKSKKGTLFNRTGRWFSYAVLTLPLIIWALSYIGANYLTFELSFVSKNIYGQKEFTLMYFEQMFDGFRASGSLLSVAFANTMKYWLLGIVTSLISLFIAYVFYKKVYFSKIYAVIIYLPSIISGVVYITVFKNLFVTYGPVWSLLYDVFGIDLGSWFPFTDQKWATPMILAYTAWSGFGGSIFIYIGVMNRVPNEVLESAKLDGCGPLREFTRIMFPILWGTYTAFVFPAFTGIFMSTGQILFFSGTNPSFNTYTLNFYIYVSTLNGNLNMGAATGLFFTILTIPIVIVTRWLMNKVDWEVQF